MAVERLMAGQAFHRTVQSAFLTGLAGASGFRERRWRLIRGGQGRVDLAVEVDGDEQMLVIIEIKGTAWDAIPADRVMRKLRRHLRQLQACLDTAIEDMEAGQWEGIPGRCRTRMARAHGPPLRSPRSSGASQSAPRAGSVTIVCG